MRSSQSAYICINLVAVGNLCFSYTHFSFISPLQNMTFTDDGWSRATKFPLARDSFVCNRMLLSLSHTIIINISADVAANWTKWKCFDRIVVEEFVARISQAHMWKWSVFFCCSIHSSFLSVKRRRSEIGPREYCVLVYEAPEERMPNNKPYA